MGSNLNMFLYRIYKIPQKDLRKYESKRYDDLKNIVRDGVYTILFIHESTYKAFPSMYRDLSPYMSCLTVKKNYVDTMQIKRDNNIPTGASILQASQTPKGMNYMFVTNDNQPHYVFVSNKDIEEKYTKEREDRMYVAYIMELRYWPKGNSTVREIVYSHIDDIAISYGYYKVSKKLMEELRGVDDNCCIIPYVDNTREGVFYHQGITPL